MKEDKDIHIRDTYIIEFYKDNKKFICNRNSDMYNTIFNDKYVKFWGVDEIYDLDVSVCDDWHVVDILYGIDNYNRRHQKIINDIKKKYIKEAIDADEEISNLQFVESVKAYRLYYKNEYKKFKDILMSIESIYDKIYDMAKKLFYKDNIGYLGTNTYWDIWSNNRMNQEQRILVIMLRDYIYDRKIDKQIYPFDRHTIKRTINNIIKTFKYNKL